MLSPAPKSLRGRCYNRPVSSTIPAGPSGGPVTTEPASHQLEATTLRISASLTLVPGVPGAPMGSGMISAHLLYSRLFSAAHKPLREHVPPCPGAGVQTISQGRKSSRYSWCSPSPGSIQAQMAQGPSWSGPHCPLGPKQHHLSPTSCKVSSRQPLLFPASRDSELVLWAKAREANRVPPATVVSLLAPGTQHPNLVSPSWAKQKIALMQICIFNFLPA